MNTTILNRVNLNSPTKNVERDSNSPSPIEFSNCLVFSADKLSYLEINNIKDIHSFEYSYDGVNWSAYTSKLKFGGKYGNLGFRGMNEYINNEDNFNTCTKFKISSASPSFKCSGNIMHLLDYTKNLTEINTEYCFVYLFCGITMSNAPELPATTLAKYCYESMFEGCTSLVNPPALPATTLASGCYESMFAGCTSLVNPPALPATTLAEYCYAYLLHNCTSLVNPPALPATTLARNCYAGMFEGCTSLVNPPALPATTLASGCYESMFAGCTSIVGSPELNATNLIYGCYRTMFVGCEKLNCIIMLATENVLSTELSNWVKGVAINGTFFKKAGVSIPSGASGIPEGWEVQEV